VLARGAVNEDTGLDRPRPLLPQTPTCRAKNSMSEDVTQCSRRWSCTCPCTTIRHPPRFWGRSMTAMIIDALGVRPASDPLEVGKHVAAGQFFWLDISGGDPSVRHTFLTEGGLSAADVDWALRFRQAGRMHIGGGGLRTVTWIADRAGNITELHLIGRNKCIATLWGGDPAALDDIRRQFAERLGGFENNLYEAAGILLQLLLGTLGSAFEAIDMKLDDFRLALGTRTDAANSAALA